MSVMHAVTLIDKVQMRIEVYNVQWLLVALGRHCRIVDRMVSPEDDWRRAHV